VGAGSLAVSAFTATHIAAALAGLTWALLDWQFNKHPTMLGMITGAVAGLVAITPASGFVGPIDAMWIGIGASVFCYMAVVILKAKFGYDDSLDVFGVHGVGGIWGALATGLWASKAVNSAGADGLFYGNPAQFAIQLKATLITVVYSGVVTFVLLKLVDVILGLRVSEDQERIGLDLTQHREVGYTVLD
jgi:Amt family ammonium transporter